MSCPTEVIIILKFELSNIFVTVLRLNISILISVEYVILKWIHIVDTFLPFRYTLEYTLLRNIHVDTWRYNLYVGTSVEC